jgi:hypothetical protein
MTSNTSTITRIVLSGSLAGIMTALSVPPAVAAPRKAQDDLFSIYNSSGASTAAKHHAWHLLRHKNPNLLRPNAFSFGQPNTATAATGFIVAVKGGRIARADKTAIIIPPGALASSLVLTISTAMARSDLEMTVRARKMDAANLVAISSGVAFGPEGTPFKTPATVILPFDTTKMATLGFSEFDLQVFRWNRDKQTWDWLSTTENPDGTVSARAPRLSVFQIFARRRR